MDPHASQLLVWNKSFVIYPEDMYVCLGILGFPGYHILAETGWSSCVFVEVNGRSHAGLWVRIYMFVRMWNREMGRIYSSL